MMGEWKEGKLVDIAEIVMGQSPKGESCNQNGNGKPLLNGPTEFSAKHPVPIQFTDAPTKQCNTGDILFCVRGSTTGRMNWADREYVIGRGVAAIRHRHGRKILSYPVIQFPSFLDASENRFRWRKNPGSSNRDFLEGNVRQLHVELNHKNERKL